MSCICLQEATTFGRFYRPAGWPSSERDKPWGTSFLISLMFFLLFGSMSMSLKSTNHIQEASWKCVSGWHMLKLGQCLRTPFRIKVNWPKHCLDMSLHKFSKHLSCSLILRSGHLHLTPLIKIGPHVTIAIADRTQLFYLFESPFFESPEYMVNIKSMYFLSIY